jgi:hypothetical protein
MEYKTRKELEEKYKLLRYEEKYQEKARVDETIFEQELKVRDNIDSLLPEWIRILKSYFRKAYDPQKA